MGGAERVVFALGALGEARQAAALAQRADAVAPPGQNLVRIGLMPDVPDQPVARRVEDIVQRHGEFDDAEARAEMPAGHRDGADRLGAQFVGEPPEVPDRQLAQIGWRSNPIEQRRLRLRHDYPLARRRANPPPRNLTTTPETARAAIARAARRHRGLRRIVRERPGAYRNRATPRAGYRRERGAMEGERNDFKTDPWRVVDRRPRRFGAGRHDRSVGGQGRPPSPSSPRAADRGFWRGPAGHCHPFATNRMCPRGYHLGPEGRRCWPD